MPKLYVGPTRVWGSPFARIFSVSVLAALSSALGSAAAAAPAATDVHALEDVVVSASRVGEQNLQSIPMAISAISPDQLDSKGLSGIVDFVGTLPSVNMQSLSPGTNEIEMRGLVTNGLDSTNSQDSRSLVRLVMMRWKLSLACRRPYERRHARISAL